MPQNVGTYLRKIRQRNYWMWFKTVPTYNLAIMCTYLVFWVWFEFAVHLLGNIKIEAQLILNGEYLGVGKCL